MKRIMAPHAMGDLSSIFGSITGGAETGISSAGNSLLGSILGSLAQNPTVQAAAATQAQQSAASGLVNFYQQHAILIWGGAGVMGALTLYLLLRK